ncbi:MAG: M48 family metalloprotease [Burkholderiales bacterium]|nr:M48 family metallopeptidase [Burkholderiales bacterium]MDQ3195968.1 M48 family metalloprotease [Pseudomonadota bacterium]
MNFRHLIAALCIFGQVARADGLPDLGDVSQGAFSPLQEQQIGESIMLEIRADKSYFADPELTDYLNDLGYRLVSNSPDSRQAFEFFLIRDSSVNAFALPGGFIGVHTGLITTAQSESELAGVLSHEVAHVTQRHLARMISGQKQSTYLSLGLLALAILAARGNSEVSQAAVAGAQATAIQSQLDFTRDHEREADRVGLQILQKSGFDPRAMPSFFERLQKSTRAIENNAPAYLRTHPLTYERIADVQSRTQEMSYKQVPDSLAFQLLRAKLRANSGSAKEALDYFEDSVQEKKFTNEAASRYGFVAALMRSKDYARAKQEMAALRKIAPASPIIDTLAGQLKIATGDHAGALEHYRLALKSHPGYRALVYDYAALLLQTKRGQEALALINDELQIHPSDSQLYLLQARSYAALDKKLLQHKAQAEAYVRLGTLPAAIEQLQIALRSGDGDFYQLSSVEARLRELRAVDQENRKAAQQ